MHLIVGFVYISKKNKPCGGLLEQLKSPICTHRVNKIKSNWSNLQIYVEIRNISKSSLPRSRFLGCYATLHPKEAAADIRTTFLSHCPCGLFAVFLTDQSHARKCKWRKVSRENVDMADNLASVTDHGGGDTEKDCWWGFKMFHMFNVVPW